MIMIMYNISVMYFKLFFNLIVPLTDPIDPDLQHQHPLSQLRSDIGIEEKPKMTVVPVEDLGTNNGVGVAMANGKV